jgi:hypothetical protein
MLLLPVSSGARSDPIVDWNQYGNRENDHSKPQHSRYQQQRISGGPMMQPRLSRKQKETPTVPEGHDSTQQASEEAERLSLWFDLQLPDNRIDKEGDAKLYAKQKKGWRR